MTSLEELRTQLSDVDDQITDLYEKRMKICEDLGICKIKNGYKTFDRQREKNKITEVMGKVSSDFNKKGIGEVYELLLAISRKLQYKQLVEAGALGRLPFIGIDSLDKDTARVVFQGTEGAYSQAAMEHYFGKGCNSYHVHTFREAMEAIEEGAADYAVLPIENSTAGIVAGVYDLLQEYNNYIIAETYIKVEHALLGLPGTDLDKVTTVYSHPQGLMQCEGFLEQHKDWNQISQANTAQSAQKVLLEKNPSHVAIASEEAAQVYGLEVLKHKINDLDNNTTRFVIVTNTRKFVKNAKKMSIVFETANEAGTLYNLLSHIIYNGLNMNKIESRPIEGREWEFRFFVDFEGNIDDPRVINALRGIEEESKKIKLLGNY